MRKASFYRGQLAGSNIFDYVFGNVTLKDTAFRVRNKAKGNPTVLAYVYSDRVCKDRQAYAPCMDLYRDYRDYCKQAGEHPLSSWQFKRNMQTLGFVWQRCHSFYVGYGKYRVTTAYKNICFDHRRRNKYCSEPPTADDFRRQLKISK